MIIKRINIRVLVIYELILYGNQIARYMIMSYHILISVQYDRYIKFGYIILEN